MPGTVNASREHLEAGVRDLAILEASYPGWLARLLTHRVEGLDRWGEAFEHLGAAGTMKVFVEVSPLPA